MFSPWHVLEVIHGPAAVAWIWRRHLGDEFAAFAAAFLQRGANPVRFYPCPRDCGCAHEVLPSPDGGDFVAICRCESWNCDDLQLTTEDILPLELNWPRLRRALGKAFGLAPKSSSLHLPNTQQMGSWSAAAVPVILTIQETSGGFRRVALELAARLRQPFILFAPTAAHLDAAAQELLVQIGAGFFSLDACAAFTVRGELHVARAPGELFSRFTPQPAEPPDEDAARRAFALVQKLETGRRLKPPGVLTVFRLYCLENLSVAQTARRLNCSKPTVLRRLELLRQKTGLQPRQLRRISGQFEDLEERVRDPRAARIRGRQMIYDNGEENER